jgi:O-antigen/teichoic acid export membrane protein
LLIREAECQINNATNLGKVSVKGSFHLMWGLVISTLIMSVGTIFIARILGSNLYGLYGIVLMTPGLISLFRDWGINSAMVKYTAQYRAEGRESEIRSILSSGLIFEIALGLVLSITCFCLSDFVASAIFHRPAIGPLIQIASLSILGGGIVNAATAAFTGIEKMAPNSIMLIAQSIIKTATMLALVIVGLSITGATIGYVVGFAVGGLIGILLIWNIYRTLPKSPTGKLQIRAYIKSMFTYGMPLSFAGNLAMLQTQFFGFLLPIFYLTDNSPIGNYSLALTFVVLIMFIAQPINTMLLPAFSKIDSEKDKETLKSVFKYSVKYTSLLVVPTAAIVMCLSKPAISTLFGNTYETAPIFLALLSITYLYSALGSYSANSFISSRGKTTYQLKLATLSAVIGFPLGYVLIMQFGVFGLIVASLTAGLPSLIISLQWIKKYYGLSLDWFSSARILFCSGITAGLTYAVVSRLPLANWIQLVAGLTFFMAIFIIIASLTKTITKNDIHYLRSMSTSLGPISRISNLMLGIIEKANNLLADHIPSYGQK